MKKLISLALTSLFVSSLLSMISFGFAQNNNNGNRYENILEELVSTGEQELPEGKQLIDFLEKPDVLTDGIWWGEWIRNTLINIWVDILLPIFVFLGIITAIIWFYKLMFSESSEDTSSSYRYIVFGILWTVLMVSAWFIATTLVGADGTWGSVFSFNELDEFDGPQMAVDLYQNLAFPFVQLLLSVILWVLFIIILVMALKMIFGNTEDETKKATNVFIYGVIWVLVISLSKTIVELVYGSYEQVTGPIEDGNLGSIGLLFDGVVAEGWSSSLSVIRSIINRILSLAVFIVVVIIIYLGFIMLFRPDDEEAFKKVKSYIVYALIGIFIIGLSYMLSRVLIVV